MDSGSVYVEVFPVKTVVVWNPFGFHVKRLFLTAKNTTLNIYCTKEMQQAFVKDSFERLRIFREQKECKCFPYGVVLNFLYGHLILCPVFDLVPHPRGDSNTTSVDSRKTDSDTISGTLAKEFISARLWLDSTFLLVLMLCELCIV